VTIAAPDMDVGPDEDVTPLFDRFVFVQSRRGYRFGIDAVLLARHVLAGPHGPGLEVGAGSGVVSVLLAGWGFAGPLTAIEIQPAMADRARRNAAANGVADRVAVIRADARDPAALPAGARFARIFSNPPFFKAGSGRANPDPERATARHEKTLDMDALLDLVRDRLAPDGVASVLYPAAREGEVLARASARPLSVVRVVPAIPAPGAEAEVVLLDLVHGRGRVCVHDGPVPMQGR